MQKHPINKVRVYFDSGMEVEFPCKGTLSVSENARKAGGYRNSQEWTEYHITWVTYKEESKSEPECKPVEEIRLQGVRAEDYLDDPTFCGIEHGVPKFRTQKTQYNFDDFGLDDIFGSSNGV